MKSLSKAIVWSQDACQFCTSAISMLKSRNVDVEVRKIGDNEKWTKKDLLEVVPDARSVPQIFVDGRYIGGFKELTDLLR